MNLIEKLEDAIEPDRSLDWEIHLRDGLEGVGAYGSHPKYTASIDTALTLVPDGLNWTINSRGEARVGGAGHIFGFMIKGGEHRYPAIALCIAAFKARTVVAEEREKP